MDAMLITALAVIGLTILRFGAPLLMIWLLSQALRRWVPAQA